MSGGATTDAGKKITLRAVSGEVLYRDPAGTLARVPPGDVLFVTLRPTTALRRLKDRYCATNAVDRAAVTFRFIGCVVEEEDTPEKLNMRDGDTIEVSMRDGFMIQPASLHHEYLALLDDATLADVELVLGPNRTILKAHRAVLCARNPHFRSLLTFPGVEREAMQIEMPDTDPQLMRWLLEYIYADKVNAPEGLNDTFELMCLADRYLCDGLKARLETALMGCVMVANVVPMLCAAYNHNADRLRRHCRHFLVKHRDEAPHQELLLAHPDAMADLIITATDFLNERVPIGAFPPTGTGEPAAKRPRGGEADTQRGPRAKSSAR